VACDPSDPRCFTFSIELGSQREGNFATLQLEDIEVHGKRAVEFTIVLNEDVLGRHANLHEFYLSLPERFDDDDDVSLKSCSAEECTVEDGRPVRGGAGARFEFSVNFDADDDGDDGKRLQAVSFVIKGLTADEVVAAAFEDPGTTRRGLEVLFAAHIQGSGHGRGSASATVGVPVPEPGTAALFGIGLVGIAFAGRRRS
jgi:hypothetical protein